MIWVWCACVPWLPMSLSCSKITVNPSFYDLTISALFRLYELLWASEGSCVFYLSLESLFRTFSLCVCVCVCVLMFVYLSVCGTSLPLECIDWDRAVLLLYVHQSVAGGLRLADLCSDPPAPWRPFVSDVLCRVCLCLWLSVKMSQYPPGTSYNVMCWSISLTKIPQSFKAQEWMVSQVVWPLLQSSVIL